MIRITRQADYGIVLLSILARAGRQGPSTAIELATESHLPIPMVSKILKALTRAGLLASLRGVKGGYQLARDPSAITVSQMIAALEGPIALTACAESSSRHCEHEGSCPSQANWQVINRAIRDVLDRITLADMAQRRTPVLAVAAVTTATSVERCTGCAEDGCSGSVHGPTCTDAGEEEMRS